MQYTPCTSQEPQLSIQLSSLGCRQGERYQIQWQESGKQKWVKRFNLLFEDESIEDFKARIHAALRRRQEVERDARYATFVDQQPWQHRDTLDAQFQQRIISLAGPHLAAKLPDLANTFVTEVCCNSRPCGNLLACGNLQSNVSREAALQETQPSLSAAAFELCSLQPHCSEYLRKQSDLIN